MGDRPSPRAAPQTSLPSHHGRASACRRLRAEHDAPPGSPDDPRAAGPVIGGLFLVAVLVILAVRVLPAARRARRASGDGPSTLLRRTVEMLPTDRSEWGDAMCAELAQVQRRAARWSFSLGCAQTVLSLRVRANLARPTREGTGLRAVVLLAAAAALGLGAYGLVRYPDLRSGPAAWASICGFVLLVLGYGAAALVLSPGATRGARAARRFGLAGGLAVAGAWLVILAPGDAFKGLVLLPLAIALLGPAAVAVLAARSTRDASAALGAALWSGLVGGLLVFTLWVTAAYVRAGGPYDAQLVRDFHRSGSHDLAAYAVGDDLGAGLSMLVLVPLLALALGSLGARLASPGLADERS